MNGTAHAAVGAAAGYFVAHSTAATTTDAIILVGIGTIAALVPDLDIDGKLRGRITLSHSLFQSIARIIGILMIIYSYLEADALWGKHIGIGIGLTLLALSFFLRQKHMLLLTGVAVMVAGVTQQENWIIFMAIYICIAALVPHRSYTHSLLGLVYFAYIASLLEPALMLEGAFYTCVLGYISHLIMDSRFLPFNKRGIKLLLPLSSKDF